VPGVPAGGRIRRTQRRDLNVADDRPRRLIPLKRLRETGVTSNRPGNRGDLTCTVGEPTTSGVPMPAATTLIEVEEQTDALVGHAAHILGTTKKDIVDRAIREYIDNHLPEGTGA